MNSSYEIDERGEQILNINLSRNKKSKENFEPNPVKLTSRHFMNENKENIMMNDSAIKSDSQTVIYNSYQSNDSLEFILQKHLHKNQENNKFLGCFEIQQEATLPAKKDNLFSFAGKTENQEEKKENREENKEELSNIIAKNEEYYFIFT